MRLTTLRTGLTAFCFSCAWTGAVPASGQDAGQTSGQPSAQLRTIERIYVEPFAVKKDAPKLRGEVVAQLRKLNHITIVSSASKADAVLTGEGEIWVRGYQSLNPRSGRLPSDGTPLYSGFLSVELKDLKGETLWSYLVTPGSPSEEITKVLSRRLEKQLAEALDGQRAAVARP